MVRHGPQGIVEKPGLAVLLAKEVLLELSDDFPDNLARRLPARKRLDRLGIPADHKIAVVEIKQKVVA